MKNPLPCPKSDFGVSVQGDHYVTLEDSFPNAGNGGDDTEALLTTVDKAVANRVRLLLLGKTYNFDQPVVIDQNSLIVEGCGGAISRFSSDSGTALHSRMEAGVSFHLKGRQSKYRDLTFSGVTDDFVLQTDLFQFSQLRDLHIAAAGDNTSGWKISEAYTCEYSNIDIWKSALNMTGIGMYHDTTGSISGGNVKFENITASYFYRGLEFGQEAIHAGQQRSNNTLINCQGRHGRTGVRFGSGYSNTTVINLWAEWNSGAENDYAQVQVHSGAGPIKFVGGHFVGVQGGHGLVLGLDPTTGDNTPICGVTVENAQIRCWGGFAGIRVYPSTEVLPAQWHEFDQIEFWNNGGSRILTEDVAQMPILLERRKYVDAQGFWADGSLIRKNIAGNPVNFGAAEVNYPLVSKTVP